jgi:hypothetical protein
MNGSSSAYFYALGNRLDDPLACADMLWNMLK